MSEQTTKKIYVGNGKAIGSTQGLRISIDLTKLAEEAKEHIKVAGQKSHKYITLNVWPNTNGADQYGNTHSVQVDTWKKEDAPAVQPPVAQSAPVQQTPPPATNYQDTSAVNDLPW